MDPICHGFHRSLERPPGHPIQTNGLDFNEEGVSVLKLRRIEMVGFKSFSDKGQIAVNDTGVTAIVGPIGCGKSNVSDAIAWVLGEQSAKSLRGE